MATRKTARQAPWDKLAPARGKHRRLGAKGKSSARAKAKRAGRRYPNLVDNMNAAKKKKK